MIKKLLTPLVLFALFFFTEIKAQDFFIHNPITLPDKSQESTIIQKIGYTDITIKYHSPSTKGREVWGKLVPYGRVWRAGANENTIFTVTHDVQINGKLLAAGSYGLHLLPNKDQWTFIFSKDRTSWGSFFYQEDKDALRVTVAVEDALEFREWMGFDFDKKERGATSVVLAWGDKRARFDLDLDIDAIALERIREQLNMDAHWEWFSWCQAADYCVQYDINTDEALEWIERSISIEKNFYNLDIKAKLLRKKGQMVQAEKIMEMAVEYGSAVDLSRYGRRLMAKEMFEEATTVFKKAAKKDPTYWRPYFNMGNTLIQLGKEKEARKAFENALERAPENTKGRIKAKIESL